MRWLGILYSVSVMARTQKIYKQTQYERQERLIADKSLNLFDGCQGGGKFGRNCYPFVLTEGVYNIYAPVRDFAIQYFEENNISWWRNAITGHTLSSQIACINHLLPIADDHDAVLSILQGINDEFVDVLPIECDKTPRYVALEAVSAEDRLNEIYCSRGSNCTSIDAIAMARHKTGKTVIVLIEWKYVELYENLDKSSEVDKYGKDKGAVRLARYSELINNSVQLKSLGSYKGSVYFQEPFYQLMRQTLWGEQVVANKDTEILKADDYMHIHVIPAENSSLLDKKYKVSGGKGMEETWRSMINDQSKYQIVPPSKLFAPIRNNHRYQNLVEYLSQRYW